MLTMIEDRERKVILHLGEQRKVIPEKKSLQVLDAMCRYYGSTYAGRREAVCDYLHIRQKAPILISQEPMIMMFPTLSAKSPSCIWINYGMVEGIKRKPNNQTLFKFKNGTQMILPIEYRSAQRQIERCHMYLHVLECHKNVNLLQMLDHTEL